MNFIESFQAVSDTGVVYEVEIWQEQIAFSSLNRGRQYGDGLKQAQLLDGRYVNYIDDDTYKIVSTDEIIRRVKSI